MKKLLQVLVFIQVSIMLININVFAQTQTDLWGMTSGGGDGYGVIFKTDVNGENIETQFCFGENPGKNPWYTNLCEVANGKLYGMTANGGAGNLGILFEYDPVTDIYTKKFDFAGGLNGSNPSGSLVLAADGLLYGMTKTGGINGNGVLFSYNPTSELFTKLLDFDALANGSFSRGSLILASDGKLYGMTRQGGTNDMGVMFSYDPETGTFIKELDFEGATNGSYPVGSLMQAANGKFYGMTSAGGSSDMGVLFEYDPTISTYTKKLDFAGTTNGRNPDGSLIEANDGLLYGMTSTGGIGDFGVLFVFDPETDTYNKIIDFDETILGSNPHGSLTEASNGKLYGMTQYGGSDSQGILFEYDPVANVCTNKLNFAGSTNGRAPIGSLMTASNGKLYGMTQYGGSTNNGVLFDFDPNSGIYNKILDFMITTSTGTGPQGSLMKASDGMLYGLALGGGANYSGVLFQYDPITGIYTNKFDFDGVLHGSNPSGTLVEATNGLLYGITLYGGTSNMGVLFEYDPETNTCTKKIDFVGAANGSYPNGSLMLADNDKLYGMTQQGGTSNYGVLFEYYPLTNTFVKKVNFDGVVNGRNPYGSLIQKSDGFLYGMTSFGGGLGLGVLFRYNPSVNSFDALVNFSGTTMGSNPYGSLVLASNGSLYGLTSQGGVNSLGVLFEYNSSGVYTKHIDFDGSANGSGSRATLMQASNGNLYGMTYQGGVSNNGVLFEFDINSDILSKKNDFNLTNGQYPLYTNLIELCAQPEFVSNIQNVNSCDEGDVSFVCAATGNDITYQWQFDDGTGFTDLIDNSMYSGSLTETLDISGVTPAMNAYEYRCVITSSCPAMSKESNSALLVVYLPYSFLESHSICEGETYTWQGIDYTETNTYTASYLSVNGCDSIYTLNLTVNPVYEFTENYSICQGDNYYWQGENRTNTDTYIASYTSQFGCDSIYILNLTANPTYLFEEMLEICEGETFEWHGETYTAGGYLQYQNDYESVFGCDSIYILHMDINELPEVIITGLDAQYCDNVTVVELTGIPAGGVFNGPGVAGSIFNPSDVGQGIWDIIYIYSDANECENIATQSVEVYDCSGIETEISENIQVYPNPNSGDFTISLNESGDYTLAIFNSLGQIVWSENESISEQKDFFVSGLVPGTYILKLVSLAKTDVLKIVIR